MLKKAMQAVVYGDVFMNVVYRTRPYEKVPGSVNALHEKWKNICIRQLTKDKVTMVNLIKISAVLSKNLMRLNYWILKSQESVLSEKFL